VVRLVVTGGSLIQRPKRSLRCINEYLTKCTILCVCHTTPSQKMFCFAYFSSDWATTTGRLLGPEVGNSIKCLSQRHSDALPHRESTRYQGYATFRLL